MSLNILDNLKNDTDTDSTSSESSLSSDEKDYQETNLNLEGKIINKFNFMFELGRGSYSIVWMVFNIEDSNFYAIKVQNSEDFEDGLSEINIMKKIDKEEENFNHLIEYFIHKKTNNNNKIDKYLCSVYNLHAGNLDSFIRKGNYNNGFPPKIAIIMFKQIITGLTYLHNKLNIFHGDIKPDNILLKGINKYNNKIIEKYKEYDFLKKYSDLKKKYWLSQGKNIKNIKKMNKQIKLEIRKKVHNKIINEIKNDTELDPSLKYQIDEKYINNPIVYICDFGDFCCNDEQHNDEFGTRYYRSPEIMLFGECDYKVDIWATGCTFYELFTGKILFDPSKDNLRNRNYYHLLNISETCGKFSKKFLKSTDKYKDYFSKNFKFKHDEVINKNNIIDKLIEDSDILNKSAGNILKETLQINPIKRETCSQILKKYF